MPEGVTFHEPQGGLFFWLTLPEGRDSEILLARALAEKVAFVPGGAFYPHKARNNEMRVNFSNVSEAEIEEGIARLGRVIRTYLSEPVKTTEEFR